MMIIFNNNVHHNIMGRKPKERLTQFQKEIVYADITFDGVKEKLNHFNELNEDGTHTNIEDISFTVTKTIFYRKLNEIKKKTELYEKARKEMSYSKVSAIKIKLEELDLIYNQSKSTSSLKEILKICKAGMKLQRELKSYR